MAQYSLSKYQNINTIIVDKSSLPPHHYKQLAMIEKNLKFGTNYPIHYLIQANNEVNLIKKVIDMFTEIDPDIVIGYETEGLSIGYLCKRAEHIGI